MRSVSSAIAVVLVLVSAGCADAPVRQAPDTFSKPVSFSILEDYDKGDDLAVVETDFKLFRELGITTWRGSFGWDDYEPERDRYDFTWLEQFVQLAGEKGIALRPYIAYTPAWAAAPGGADDAVWNDPPDDIGEWHEFVAMLATNLSTYPHVLSFEIYNEVNASMWWDGTPQTYSRVLEAGSMAVRAAGGNDEVLYAGLTYPDLEWIEATCTGTGDDFDILPIHAYPETWTPEGTVIENYLGGEWFQETFLPAVDEACGRKAIWLNEVGAATVPGERDEREQANWWARAFATFLAEPRIEHLGIYEIREPERSVGQIGGTENYHLGLIRSDGRRKLAFHTVQRLVDLLDTRILTVADGELSVEVVEGRAGDLYHHLFIRPDGRQILFVWDKGGSPVVRLNTDRPGSGAFEYALDGTRQVFQRFDGRSLLGVRLEPGEVRIFEIRP